MTKRYSGINGMSGKRLAEYEQRLATIVNYLTTNSQANQLPNHKIAKKLSVTAGSVLRAKYMIEHSCSASEAIDAIGLQSTAARPNHCTWLNEFLNGQASIDLLTRSWSSSS